MAIKSNAQFERSKRKHEAENLRKEGKSTRAVNNRKKHHQVCKLLSSLEDVVLRFGFGDFKHLAGGSSECVHTCLLLEARARLDTEQQRAGVGLPVGWRDAARHVQQ